ncbi:hypothetical protein [Myxococcus sp. RHSTA-1-4]|uniref:hypothetical protein n=1 Tax=Myxococcus sp. RHSTA-1-4 TaxID=2874601 RepID=UPI001CBB7ABA|nr:hypothetical protein [Myxococcus sp. RHSTA-1-4]MBZ4417289.1 hypothetical protein [Myxococcus sp. RHSTA-1-4]
MECVTRGGATARAWAGAAPRRAALGALLAALGLWGCGATEEAPEQASPESREASLETGACAGSEVELGSKTCTGSYQYSLKCHALMQSAACGVDPNAEPSDPPVYLACRSASHPIVSDSLCGSGFLGTVSAAAGLTLDEVKARAAQQWATARGVGTPDFDVPITCTQCIQNVWLPAEAVQRRIYAAAALSRKDAKLHVLAGTAWGMLEIDRENQERAAQAQPPGVYVPLTAAELSAGLANVASVLDARAGDTSLTGVGSEVRTMLRVLDDVQPYLGHTSPGAAGFTRYARSVLQSMRTGLDARRQLTAILPQTDRYMEAEAFISGTWAELFDGVRGRPELAAVVDGGRIGTTLGILTTTSARDMLTAYPLEPLKGFVLAHLQANGSLVVLPSAVDAEVSALSKHGLDMAQDYATSLYTLDAAEQAYRTAISLSKTSPATTGLTAMAATAPSETEAKDALALAIKAAKAEGETIKSRTSDVKVSVSSALELLGDAYKKIGEETAAKDLARFGKALDSVLGTVQKYHESAIKTAEAVSNILQLGATGFNVISAALFTGNLLGSVGQLAALFSDTPEEPVQDVVKAEAAKTRELIASMAKKLEARFDRTDKKLDALRAELLIRLDTMKWELGETHYDVNELQRALYSMQTDLMRLDRNIYAMMDELHRKPFLDATTYYLGYEARMQEPLSFEKFGLGESAFLSRATTDATGFICAGPPSWDSSYFTEDGVLNALMSRMLLQNEPEPFGYADSINFMREVPTRLLGRPLPLSGVGLANPVEWMAGAEAYAQLNEESPAHATQVLGRTDRVMAVGTALDAALRNIDQPLFDKLVERYTRHWTELKDELGRAKEAWEEVPGRNLSTLDVFGGADQLPTAHYLKQTVVPLTCNGGAWTNTETTPAPTALDLSRWNHDALRPLMAADNLDLDQGELSHCVGGHWELVSSEPNPWGYTGTFRLKGYLDIRYKFVEAGVAKNVMVFRHTFSTNIETTDFVHSSNPTYDPDTALATNYFIQKNWYAFFAAPATHVVKDEALVAKVRGQVGARLTAEQRAFYASVATRMEEAGDILGIRAKRLAGSKLLWESFIALALPLSLEHDEDLRGLLYGTDAALSGVDVLAADDDLNDVQDSYRFFANAGTLPAYNVVTDIDSAFTRRKQRLHDTVTNILARNAAAGEFEGAAWTQATLLRLRLSDPTPVTP